MRFLAATALAAAVFPAAAWGQQATIVQRDVPLGSTRSLASGSAPERFDLVGLHWQGTGTVRFRDAVARRALERMGDRCARGGGSARRRHGRACEHAALAARQPVVGRASPTASSTGGPGRVTRLRAFFVWSPSAAIPLRTLQKAGAPPIVSRAGWGADESIRRAAPRYAPSVRVAVVHHTAGSNGYTAAESAAIVRGIQVYHVKGNGWNDIGYNFLVDKYGKVFEGRYGGIDRNVVGAHAEGFNTGSVGVAVLGEYSSLAVAAKAQEALARVLAWRLDLAHVEPGHDGLVRLGRQPALRARRRRSSCARSPGTATRASRTARAGRSTALLGDITGDVAELGLPKLYAPVVTGAVPGSVRFRARLSAALDWTIEVTDSRGATVASTTGYGQAVDWTWPASGLPAGRYSYAIRAPDVTPALGQIGGGELVPEGTLASRASRRSPPR